jgi:UDP-N-acetylglucosamine 2-epimerase
MNYMILFRRQIITMKGKKVAIVLGIRPDIIRASKIIRLLDDDPRVSLIFIWSGQHYSDNMKDIFFRELAVRQPDIELNARGENDAELVSKIIARLYEVLAKLKPEGTLFLGDTNTVTGCLAAAQLNIPIFHIEGCMRSYDWQMPEEKYRTMIDHLSDVIYAYLPAYRDNGIKEGLCPSRIVVTGNPIVDVLNEKFLGTRNKSEGLDILARYKVKPRAYAVMTCHRRENIDEPKPLSNIIKFVEAYAGRVLFFVGYRTQRRLREYAISIPSNVTLYDPTGYQDLLYLMDSASYVFTDSGTIIEEACILGIPSIQMRLSTERPEVYEVGSSVRFNPRGSINIEKIHDIISSVKKITPNSWNNPFGDGKASERIVNDIVERVMSQTGAYTHEPDFQMGHVKRAFVDLLF